MTDISDNLIQYYLYTQGGAPYLAKLVQITQITMAYCRYIYTYYGL